MGPKILPLDNALLDQITQLYEEDVDRLTHAHYHDEELYLNILHLAKKLGFEEVSLKDLPVKEDLEGYIEEVVHRLGLSMRKVALPQDQDDSKDLTGTLVFDRKTLKSYVVCATLWGKQRLYDAQTGQFSPYNGSLLLTEGFYIYRPFVEAKSSFSEVLKRLMGVLKGEMLLLGIFMISGTLLSLLMPLFLGVVLDNVIPFADLPLLGQVSLGLLVLSGLIYLGSLGQSSLFIRLKSRGSLYILSGVWGRIFTLPLTFFRRFTVGDLALRAGGIELVFEEMTMGVMSMMSSMVFTVLGTFLIASYSVSFAALTFCVGLVYGALFMMTSYKQMKFARHVIQLQSQIHTHLVQIVKNIQRIKITKDEPHTLALWRRLFLLKMRSTIAYTRFANLFSAGTTFLSVTMTITVFVFLMGEDGLSFGTTVMLLSLYTQLVGSITSWMSTLSGFVHLKPYIERIKPVFEAAPEACSQVKLIPLKGAISFENVSFGYADYHLFSNLNFEIPPGKFVALVGASGVGKSTLMKLIMGLETPQRGHILLDKTPLERLDTQHLRRQMGVVLQTPAFIPGNILENITMMDARVTLQCVWDALALARLNEDIAALPMGLFTPVSELGKSFSSGQIQRLMIARALVRRPSMLLFDEPTSALDNVTQAHIMDALHTLPITRIISAHRFSTIEKADEILVLENGHIVERGTFENLCQREGVFKSLYHAQKSDQI